MSLEFRGESGAGAINWGAVCVWVLPSVETLGEVTGRTSVGRWGREGTQAWLEGTRMSTSHGLARRSIIPGVVTWIQVRGEDGVLSSQMSKRTAVPLPRAPMC